MTRETIIELNKEHICKYCNHKATRLCIEEYIFSVIIAFSCEKCYQQKWRETQ